VVMTGPAVGSVITPDEEADGNLVANGYFNDGTATDWTVSGGVVEALNGDYALKATTTSRYSNVAEQTITVEANSDYTLDVESYYNGSLTGGIARVHIYAGASGTSELASPSYYWNITAGAWDSHQLTFNSGENTQVRIVLQQHAAPSSSTAMDGNIYYDNFNLQKVVPAPDGNDTPSNDGYITNGDFETGDLTGWTVTAANITWTEVANGNFSLQGTNTAKYGAFVKQTIAVEANTDYVLTFKAKLAASGGQPRFYIKDGAEAVTLNSSNYYFTGSTEWTTYQIAFNSGEYTSLVIYPAQGVTNGGDVYYDDIVMEKAQTGYQGLYPETMTSGADIRFMTYNVLVGQDTNKGGYSWGTAITGRPEKACAMINYYKPDVIALEEFSGEWYEYFQANMPDYAFGIMDSEDTQNNGILYTCIAYNVNTIRLLDTDLFRNTVSRWGTQGMRYVNVGFCEVIATGEKFIAAVTHPDAGELVGTDDVNGDGVAEEGAGYWRPQQLEEAAAYVAGLSNEHKMPVIWGGDFNSGLDGTYDDNVSWYKVADAGFTDATAGRYIDHIFYNSMATHLYETTVADAAVNGASDHKAVFADIQFLDEFATPIKDAKDYIKTQGRNTLKDGALWLDFSASGIEFSANCEGKVALNLNVKSLKQTDSYGGLYFTVIVDGVKVDRAQCHITSTGDVELVLAENLPVGNHTFEVYRQTEHRGAEVGISSIVMNGSFNEKPADNRLYIEFIGDSISTGFGALGTSSDSDGGSPKWQDATAAYPYLVAKALGADFSDVAYSGIGAKYGYQDPNMQNFYPYQRWQYDRTTQYNFNARQPDVVVIALGTNDIANQADAALRKVGYQEMLDLVRTKNPDAKIVWIYGMMKDDDNTMIADLIEENGGAAAGLYSLELVTNTAGAGWHPSAAGQQKFADDLVAYLNSDVLVRYVGDEVEDYDIITFGGNSIRENVYGSGLAFKFNVKTTGMAVTNKTQAVYDNAIVDVFGDGGEYKLVKMGAVVANTPACGDLKLDDVDDERVLNIEAVYLCNLTTSSASFSVRILDIPEDQQDTLIYARPYYVFEYEGREVIAYGDAVQANCNNKYDSNDGVLEW
ncbi:MAG: carbohydrate binding domain-containing protein, partial [Clostridia bacterium]|nr:carbohydrate binding domain-containing protein [Clostridia bacterium]